LSNNISQDLEFLESFSATGEDSETKVALSKVALEVNSRLQGAPGSPDFMKRVIEAIRRMPGSIFADIRVNCLLDASHYFYLGGQAFTGIESVAVAVDLAWAAQNISLHRKALTLAGVMYADTGNTSRAIECYAKALEEAQTLRDSEAECAVWVNLGVALLYAAQYHDSLSCFEHTVQLAGKQPQLQKFRTAALSNIALCCLHLEDFARGLKASETCLRESAEPHSTPDLVARVLRENNYIRLLLEIGSIDQAAERCALAKRFAAKSKSARAEMAASIAEGLYEVEAGQVDAGLTRLTRTLERARTVKAMLRDTLAALVKAHEAVGQPDLALKYLREMIDSISHTQQENALKHLAIHTSEISGDGGGEAPLTSRLHRQEAALRGKIAEQELFRSRIEMLERLAVTAELRDDSTGEHSYRVGKLAALLAHEFGCDTETCHMIELAARLHDIGKIGVPDAILLKPEKLNDSERQIMRTHTTVGAELLSKSAMPQMQLAEEIARHHHEWWNGSGYPGNLAGEDIPLGARITSLADVFDALTHKRPYKIAWPIDAALDEIFQLKGVQFDPQLTDLFVVLVGQLRRDHIDLDSFLGQAATGSPFLQARSRIWNVLHKSHDRSNEGSGSRLDMQR